MAGFLEMGEEIRRAIEEEFDEQPEIWVRRPDEYAIRDVAGLRMPGSGWSWYVNVDAMETIGGEPFEPAMRDDLLVAMSSVTEFRPWPRRIEKCGASKETPTCSPLGRGKLVAVVDRYADQVHAVLDQNR